MSIIARLGVILGLNSAEFTKGLDEATKKTKEFERNQKTALKNAEQATMQMKSAFSAATVAAGALAFGFVKVAQAADQMMDTAAALDMTVESLIAAKAALQGAGGEADNLATMMNKLASVQDGAREGSDSLRESFNRLGISGKDVDSLSLDELFKRVASELAKVEDVTKRTAIAQDMLGKAAKGVNWSDFVDKYKQVADPALASAIRENAAAWENIEETMKSIDQLVQKLVAPFSALLNSMFDLVKLYKEIKNGGDVDVDWGAAMGGMPGQDGATTSHKGSGTPKSGPIAKPGQTGGYGKASEAEKAAAEKARKEREAAIAKMIADVRKMDAEWQKFAGTMAAIYTAQVQVEETFWKEYYINVDLLELEKKRYGMTIDQYANEKMLLEQKHRLIRIEIEATQQLAAARQELERASAEEAWYAQQIYEEKVKNIETIKQLQLGAVKEYNKLETEEFDARVERQYDFFEGFKNAARRSAEESEKVFKLGETAFQSMMGNMESALQNFVQTGKLNFKDFARSVIADLLAIAMKAQAIQFFANVFGLTASVSVGKTSNSTDMDDFAMQQYPGMATGGYATGPTLVGENGPELFVPHSPGTVIPNGSWQQMASSRGGMTVNGPYIANLSTIDSKSFEQRIYESNKAVWAAGQYAQKSLAMSGGRS